MVRNDGGPAYPGEQGQTPEGYWNQTWNPGMSLRDWFAGMSLVGLSNRYNDKGDIAKDAFDIADAMLAQREAQIGKENP